MNFKYPTWQDFEKYWESIDVPKRVEYVADALNCAQENPIVQTTAQQHWNGIPESLIDTISGESQMSNDLFNLMNE